MEMEKKQNKHLSKEEFLELISILKITFEENEWYFRAKEENIKSEIIEPILKALGWKPPFIRHEDKNTDYLLCNNKYFNKCSPKITIEVKKYCEQLRTIGGDKKEIKPANEDQLIKYCNNSDIHALIGILTNGIRWCLYSGKDFSYKGEIDIRSTPQEDIWKFFHSISKSEFENIYQNDWGWLPKQTREEFFHTTIRIDNDPPYIDNHCEASYKVARLFIDKCEEMSNEKTTINPLDFVFYRQIISKDLPLIKKKKRGSRKKKKVARSNIPYKSYYLIGDYSIYDKVTLLKEVNSTLDLGLNISIE